MNADYQNNDYQLDDMENEAVNKSQTAKRVLIGVGALAGGAGIAYAAGLMGNDQPLTDDQQLDVNALLDGANAGAVEGFPIQAEIPAPVVHQHIHIDTAPEHIPEVKIETTTIVYDEGGNPMMIIEEGTIDGRMFAVVDQNCDGVGDVLIIDYDNDGRYEENEAILLDQNDPYIMGHGELHEVDVNGNPVIHESYGDDVYAYDEPGADGEGHGRGRDDLDDIENDFNGRSGENYRDDLADNNPDYNPNGDTGHYSANGEGDELAYNEEDEIEFDENENFELGMDGTRGGDDIEITDSHDDGPIGTDGGGYYDESSGAYEIFDEEGSNEDIAYEEPDAEPAYDDSASEPSYEESTYEEPSYDEPSYEPDNSSSDFDSTDDVLI